jgi:hypothetical protein
MLLIDCDDMSFNIFTSKSIEVGTINRTPNRNLSRTTITIMTIITSAMYTSVFNTMFMLIQ